MAESTFAEYMKVTQEVAEVAGTSASKITATELVAKFYQREEIMDIEQILARLNQGADF